MEVGTVRISVEEKEEHRYQLQKHLKALSEAGSERLFYDVCSRNTELKDRPGLQRLIDLIETGVVTRVYIPDIERLTVNVSLLQDVIKKCRQFGVELISINMGIDHTTESGELLAMITAAGGKFEWSRIQKRTKRNADFEKQHNLLKRGCFGYRLNKGIAEFDTTPFLCLLTPDFYESSDIERIEGIDRALAEFKRHLDGKQELSKYDIALKQILLLFEHKTLNRTIAAIHNHFGIMVQVGHRRGLTTPNEITPNEIDTLERKRAWQSTLFQWSYSGFRGWAKSPLLYQAIWHPEKDQPVEQWQRSGIITKEIYNQICFLVSQKSPVKRSGLHAERNIFYKKVFCGRCGKACSLGNRGTKRKNGKQKRLELFFQCSQWIKDRVRLRLDPEIISGCNNQRTVRIEVIESALIDLLVKRANEIAKAVTEPKDLEEAEWTPEMVELENEIRKLESLRMKEVEPIIREKRSRLEIERSRLTSGRQKQVENNAALVEYFQNRTSWENFSLDTKRLLISEWVERIEILDGSVSSIQLA
jgi:predicted site-specific integrase-resolvase